jgi:hypothetical protein
MIDQLILEIGDKSLMFMLTQTTLFIAEGVHFGDSFAFDPNNRLEIRPVSWQTTSLAPLCEHERELRQLYHLHQLLTVADNAFQEKAN